MATATHADAYTATPDTLSEETVRTYHERGFVRIRGALSPAEAATFAAAALNPSLPEGESGGTAFRQLVNIWRTDETLRRLTFHPGIAAMAERLAGFPLRLWHDQTLIKVPGTSTPTEFHQDRPFWPHADSPDPISAWIALVDVPVERGCMTFIPGSHTRTDLRAQNLHDDHDLFSIAPDLAWEPRVTLPLRAGDCTFHHGLCAHMANANRTDDPRVAHVVIFMAAGATYTGMGHPVTDPLDLTPGQPLDGDLFPPAADFAKLSAG